ncbi:MAG: ECF transporter S component [Anaerolineae bacterium]|jgi:uncharacterized membrane protein
MRDIEIRQIVLTGVMIALVFVFTWAIRVPFTPTGGYFNLSDVAVLLTGIAFGPWTGLLAGGLGTALADLVGGYTLFAPLTFLAHGLEGLVAGAIVGRHRGVARMVLGWAAGASVMLAIYFLGEAFIFRMGVGPAAAEFLTINLPQAAGGFLSIPLFVALRRAYPPILQWGGPRA